MVVSGECGVHLVGYSAGQLMDLASWLVSVRKTCGATSVAPHACLFVAPDYRTVTPCSRGPLSPDTTTNSTDFPSSNER